MCNKEIVICAAIWVQDGKKRPYQPTNIPSGTVFCGLFQSSIGKLINADINGSIGIARKVIGDSFIGKIIDSGFVFNPIRVNTL